MRNEIYTQHSTDIDYTSDEFGMALGVYSVMAHALTHSLISYETQACAFIVYTHLQTNFNNFNTHTHAHTKIPIEIRGFVVGTRACPSLLCQNHTMFLRIFFSFSIFSLHFEYFSFFDKLIRLKTQKVGSTSTIIFFLLSGYDFDVITVIFFSLMLVALLLLLLLSLSLKMMMMMLMVLLMASNMNVTIEIHFRRFYVRHFVCARGSW